MSPWISIIWSSTRSSPVCCPPRSIWRKRSCWGCCCLFAVFCWTPLGTTLTWLIFTRIFILGQFILIEIFDELLINTMTYIVYIWAYKRKQIIFDTNIIMLCSKQNDFLVLSTHMTTKNNTREANFINSSNMILSAQK